MEGRLSELNQFLNQALQEKKLLQNEVTRLSIQNMELFEEKEKKIQKDPNVLQEIKMKVYNKFIFFELFILKSSKHMRKNSNQMLIVS